MKKVAVITSIYNGERFISQTIKSILLNDHSLFDYYILNNGSTDNTKNILQRYSKKTNVYLHENEKVKPRTVALNQIISKLRNQYSFFTVIDSDDLIDKNWIKTAYEFMLKNPDVFALSGQFFLINDKNIKFQKSKIPIYPKKLNEYFSFTFPVVHSGLFIRLNKIKRNEIYDDSLTFGQDWDLCIYLAKRGVIAATKEYSVSFRHHNNSLTKLSSNQIQSRIDKLYNIKQAKALVKNPIFFLKNKNREASEMLALGFLYFKIGEYFKSIKYILLGLLTFPFALILNNKVMTMFQKKNRINCLISRGILNSIFLIYI